MVYYLTSTNIKLMRNIHEDFSQCDNYTPYEYMKKYIENCPEEIDDEKLTWIAETFLGLQKHKKFLQDLSSKVTINDIPGQEPDYMATVLYAVIFQLQPEEKESLYKCMFNLSKDLLQRFTLFFSNNEVLPFVSQVACAYYDVKFVTEKIISPLFLWQPYISEMSHDFETYAQRVLARNVRPPTIPSVVNVLNRQPRPDTIVRIPVQGVTYKTSKTTQKKCKMLTKSAIDQRLKIISEQHKQRAALLLNEVKTQEFNFAKNKSNKYYKTIANIQYEMENSMRPQLICKKPNFIKSPAPVKDTITTIKRMSKNVAKTEKEEIRFMEDILKSCRNTMKISELEDNDRKEKERERQVTMEKNRLMGQISYEDAILAKQNITDENKKKYEEFIKEKEMWIERIEQWKQEEMKKNKEKVERLSLIELELLEAKTNLNLKKKEEARSVKDKTEFLLAKALKENYEELQRKVNMIKEIKVLALIASKAKIPKIIDLTESSGFGFLCEMSIAELQERLTAMKMDLKEELEAKKKAIKCDKDNAKRELEETKNMIQQFVSEKATLRNKKNVKDAHDTGFGDAYGNIASREILDLKKSLEEKRKERLRVASSRVQF